MEEDKFAEEYECCSDEEKGKRPIGRWDVSKMHDADAKVFVFLFSHKFMSLMN